MRLSSGLALGLWSAFAVLFALACGDGGSSDPRCVSLCTIKQPSTPGAGDICSQASADACGQQCGAEIAGSTAACGDCLLQGAEFGTGSFSSSGGCDPTVACPGGGCSDSGPGGSCTYCADDMAAEQACYVKAHPRQEVACDTTFGDPTKCTALCAAK